MPSKALNQYEIVRRLGAGGAGVVYLANDTRLRRPVVIKVLRPGTSDARERILREARLASAVDHPNVCAVYEASESDGEAFIAMQYVPGRPLDDVIASGALNLRLAVSIGMQMADGLAAAHRLGIVHGDLKPANVMLTEGGLVKILDFGLARRRPLEEEAARGTKPRRVSRDSAAKYGTVAYMAPEQFVTGRGSAQSDVFAFGEILYEMVTGKHPFAAHADQLPMMQGGGVAGHVARAIQYSDPTPPHELRPDLPGELEGVILKALAKQPAARFDTGAEVREALRTVAQVLRLESDALPDAGGAPPVAASEAERKAGFFSLLVERFMGGVSGESAPTSIVVLPFRDVGEGEAMPFYGLALADAVSARLAAIPDLVVRPSRSAVDASADATAIGRRLLVTHVVGGSFVRHDEGFDLTWQLVDVATNEIRTGGTVSVASLDLVAIQNEICDEVYASLRGTGHLRPPAAEPTAPSLTSDRWEAYLEARALLSKYALRSSARDDLDAARDEFRIVLAKDSTFALAHSGLGIVFLEYARKGFGGLGAVIDAQRSFERALRADPELVEARLYQAYVLLWRGEKDAARRSVIHLLGSASNNFDVRVVAATVLRLDGVYGGALEQLVEALRLNPAGATVVYDDRARIYHYQGHLDLATEEINKGLTLEPRHPLLRASAGYLAYRRGDVPKAIEILEAVLLDDPKQRMLYPSLAICYAAVGQREQAAELLTDEVLASADADGEMAYRLATYFATSGEVTEALHWLRKSIYLGNENYPWMSRNPAWERLRDDDRFQKIMADLAKAHRANARQWKRLLGA